MAARIGGKPLGVVGISGQDPTRHDVGSAFRLAEVARRLTLQTWSAQMLEELRDSVVVLVDDWSDSGWTLTVAASLLREAGRRRFTPSSWLRDRAGRAPAPRSARPVQRR